MTSVPKPLIIQADRSILLDVHAPEAVAARKALVSFAELEKSPEHLHSYRLTPLSLWNAASAGFSPQMIAQTLTRFSRFTPPQTVLDWVVDIMSRYGKIRLREDTTHSTLLRLQVRDAHIAREIAASK
ncbi:helicase-associated domain-containing protein, partial [Treponema pallidum]